MASSVVNIVLGLVAVAAGLSGKFTLIGTSSSTALVVIGGAIAAYGVVGVLRHRSLGRPKGPPAPRGGA